MRASDGDGDAKVRVNGGFLRLTWLYIQITKKHSVASSTDSVSALTEALNSHHAARAALTVFALLLLTACRSDEVGRRPAADWLPQWGGRRRCRRWRDGEELFCLTARE